MEVLAQRFLDQRLTANGIIIEDHAVTPNIEGKFPSTLSEHDRRLAKGMGVADLIVDIRVRRRDFGDHHLGIFDLLLDVLEDDAWSIDLIDSAYCSKFQSPERAAHCVTGSHFGSTSLIIRCSGSVNYTRFFSSCMLSPSPRISLVKTSKLAGVPASSVFSPLTMLS